MLQKQTNKHYLLVALLITPQSTTYTDSVVFQIIVPISCHLMSSQNTDSERLNAHTQRTVPSPPRVTTRSTFVCTSKISSSGKQHDQNCMQSL